MDFLWPDSILSTARAYDKWSHAAGASFFVAVLWLLQVTARNISDNSYWGFEPLRRRKLMRRDLWLIWGLVCVAGLWLEFWEGIISPLDIAANALGGALAAWAIYAARR